MRRPSDPLDALVGLGDGLGQGRCGEVGQLDGLEAGPQALGRVQLRGVGEQALDHQPVPLSVQPAPHGAAAMSRQPVPQQGGLLPTQEPAQLAQDLDGVCCVAPTRGVVNARHTFGSDCDCELGEGDRRTAVHWLLGGQLVVSTAKVLDEGMPGDDHPGAGVLPCTMWPLKPSHLAAWHRRSTAPNAGSASSCQTNQALCSG
jgi:hypothetical protein